MKDNGARQSPAATSLDHAPVTVAPARDGGESAPTLVVAFELERRGRAMNAAELSDGDLIRLVDWITQRPGHGALDFETWLESVLRDRRARREKAA